MEQVQRTPSGGASNGLSTKRAFDRWYRYPAGFSPSSLDLAMHAVACTEGGVIADPFAGTASVGTESVARGARFIGLEAHPEIAQLASLKFERRGLADGLVAAAETIAASSQPRPVASEPELVRRCFSVDTLADLVGLRETILEASEHDWGDYLKWALLGTLRDVATVKVGWPYQRPSLERAAPHRNPAQRFLQRARWMADDLAAASSPRGSIVVAGDSRQSATWTAALDGATADACVASPPYLNNFDYADATRLELYFWGSAASWKEMCGSVRAGMLVATTQQTRKAIANEAGQQLKRYPRLDEGLAPLLGRLETERKRRPRGKEYDRVIGPYFIGLAGVLSNLFEALKPRARCAWLVGDSAPYGVYVDTPSLISALAADLGYEPISDLNVRTRGQRWRTNGVRHRVELSERLITFRKP